MGQGTVSQLYYALVAAASLAQVRGAPADRRQSQPGSEAVSYVDPLIGTVNGGHVFAGASLPFGMAKAVGDVNGESQGGFASDGSMITGFSHMHDSGTGGGSSLGNFPLFPYPSCPNGDPSQCTYSKSGRAQHYVSNSVKASPGYFTLTLEESQIQAEMTVTNHTALYRFTFPNATTKTSFSNGTYSPVILVAIDDLGNSARNGQITVDPTTGRTTGKATFTPSFGEGSYDLSFCADFQGARIRNTSTAISGTQGAYVQFAPSVSSNQILARVGVSFISAAQACSNAEKEISDFGFDKVRSAAESAWADKLSVITIDDQGLDDNIKTTFWSGVYRSMLSPQDYTGENPLWESDEPYYDSFYCIWDSFRSIHQLITLLDPESQTRMIRSLIDIYNHEGYLPDCRMSLDKGFTQGGSNADVVLADSYLKGIKDGVNWANGYEAVVKDAEVEAPNWDIEGRGGLTSYHSLGYIPIDDVDTLGTGTHTRSISRTVEYAYDDFCIAEMAQAMGKTSDADKYFGRAGNWKTLFKANQTSAINGADTGFVGYLQPKYTNGSWAYQDPLLCSPLLDFTGCYLNPTGHETYEGSCWLYTFFAPGDMAALVTTLGGADSFNKRLDYMHDQNIVYIGDEQGFLTVFQYHFAGRPGLSSKRAHYYIPSQFNDTIVGIPGNDDSGAMGSFSSLTMMGIFPNPGQNVYFITPPFFASVSIKNRATGNTATIKNINFDAAYKNIYVQSAKLNGQTYTKNWIDHSFFLNGGTLELTLGSTESDWGTKNEDLPPSLSTTGSYPGVGQG